MNKITPAVRILIIINVSLFLLSRVTPFDMTGTLGLYLPVNDQYAAWQYLTGMFLHHGFFHLVINMAGLFFFGCVVERTFGSQRFLALYFLAGIGSGLIFTLVESYQYSRGLAIVSAMEALEGSVQALSGNDVYQQVTRQLSRMYRTEVVGASGALYGLIVAVGMRFPNAKVSFRLLPFPIVAKYFVLGLLCIDLALELAAYSPFGRLMVAHSAHLGGAFIGLLVVLYWRYRSPNQFK